ncbi:MAG: hypothetical protein J6Y29_02490 [Clostridiales bacterium]|nr:hypothetical protein [Clostridiales bacterium]
METLHSIIEELKEELESQNTDGCFMEINKKINKKQKLIDTVKEIDENVQNSKNMAVVNM